MEFLYPQNAFPIKINSHSFHFDLSLSYVCVCVCVFYSPFKQKIATGKESRLNNLLSARFFFFPEVSKYSQSWAFSRVAPKSKAKLQLHGKKIGKCPVECKPTHSCLPCSKPHFWLDQLEFSFEEKSVPGLVSGPFLHSSHSRILHRVIHKPVGKEILSFSL